MSVHKAIRRKVSKDEIKTAFTYKENGYSIKYTSEHTNISYDRIQYILKNYPEEYERMKLPKIERERKRQEISRGMIDPAAEEYQHIHVDLSPKKSGLKIMREMIDQTRAQYGLGPIYHVDQHI